MPKAVLFDMDGTLVDSVDLHARAWQRTLARFGHDIDLSAIRSQIGKGGDQLMPVFLSEAEIQRDGEAIEAARSALFKSEYLSDVKPFPNVANLFQMLQDKGLRTALGSSGKAEELDHYKRLLAIDGMDLVQTTSEDAARSKPHPDIFMAALDKLHLPGTDVIAVGDSPYDALAANKAGIACVGLRCGGFAEEDLMGAGCITLYKDPADLLARFAGSPLDDKR